MIKEDIEKIKNAEEESEKIIKMAELKVKEMLLSIDSIIKEITREYKERANKEIEKYKIIKEKEKKERIKNMEKQTEEIKNKIKEKEKDIEEIAEKIWKEILSELCSNNSIFT